VKYIAFTIAAVDEIWLRRAERAAKRAAAKPTEKERAKYIRSSAAVWTALKETLEGLSGGKCWYTEAKDKVSYWHVDHYRPKSLYPWLAFTWHNLRLCGSKPNVRKLNEFPLAHGSARGTEAGGLGGETPILLDPTRWGDPDLLTFKANGEPVCAKPQDEVAAARVKVSVKLLDLDSETLCAHRREKWRKCAGKLKSLRELVEHERQQANHDAVDRMHDLCRDLAALYDDDAEFTAAAWACAQELNADKLVRLAVEISRKLPEG
jgi:uncharacterized protein (TIGR02646 family)